jgi:hypothetical protein
MLFFFFFPSFENIINTQKKKNHSGINFKILRIQEKERKHLAVAFEPLDTVFRALST